MNVDEARILVKEIEKVKFEKTAWESAFLAKMRDMIKAGARCSPAQSLSLQSIYRKSQEKIK
jgi:hypothetical protein